MSARTPLDRLRDAAESETIRATLLDLIVDALNPDDLREWVDAAETLLETIDETTAAIEEWRDEEDREARADARERAAEVLGDLVDAFDGFLVWGSLPERADDEAPTTDPDREDERRHADNRAWIETASATDLDGMADSLTEYPDEVAARRAELTGEVAP